jgi:serine protease Do
LPALLNDAARRENFSFDNITHVNPAQGGTNQGNANHTPMGAAEGLLLHRQDYVALVDAVKPGVVAITAEVPGGSGIFASQGRPRAGTGILMYETESRYYIATNAHVIEGASSVNVSIEGSRGISAVPIGRDSDADLAVIAVYKADAITVGIHSVVIARFGDSQASQVGEIVIAVGNAMGDGISVTNGIISAKDIQIAVAGRRLDTLQTNAAINSGNSGGPLVNVYGDVIGINTAKLSVQLGEGMAYAIPSHVAKPILERIIRESTDPTPQRPIMGVVIDTWTEVQAAAAASSLINRGISPDLVVYPTEGVRLSQISARSPAQQAGLRPNDIVTAIDNTPIATSDDFIAQMYTKTAGQEITLTIIRNGLESLEIKVTLIANTTPIF